MQSKIYCGIIDIFIEGLKIPKQIGLYELELPYGTSESPTTLQEAHAQQFMFQFQGISDLVFNYQGGRYYIDDCFGDIIKKKARRYLDNSWPSILRTSSSKHYEEIVKRLADLSGHIDIPLLQNESVKTRLTKLFKELNFAEMLDYSEL